jgi:hypothetical protein
MMAAAAVECLMMLMKMPLLVGIADLLLTLAAMTMTRVDRRLRQGLVCPLTLLWVRAQKEVE